MRVKRLGLGWRRAGYHPGMGTRGSAQLRLARGRDRSVREVVADAHWANLSASNELIAGQTGLPPSTVARHRKRIGGRAAGSAPAAATLKIDLTDSPGADVSVVGSVRIHDLLADVARAAFESHLGEELDDFDPQIRRAGADHDADYQANGFIGESRRRGLDPVEVATAVAERIGKDPAIERAAGSGPGFVNFTLSDSFLASWLMGFRVDAPAAMVPGGRRVVVDYSSPNVSKEMHVGHLRSTIIGDALVRMFEFDGADVVLQNHIGDWGTPFGMLIEHLVDAGMVAQAGDLEPREMGDLYRDARARFDSDSDFCERARHRVVLLQSDDPVTTEIWTALRDASCAHFGQAYRDLGVLLDDDDIHGESAYRPMLDQVVAELADRGLLVDSDGALCAFPTGFKARDGSPLALIVRKADDSYGYAATDLAAIRYRTQQLDADHLVYVVGTPQRTHLAMVFAVARAAGWLDGAEVSHAAFGSVLGPDNKMLKSREGEPVPLSGLIDEAIRQVSDMAAGRDNVGAGEVAAIAVSALKYADLSNDRVHDYKFDPKRMTSLDGETGPYLLYAHTRAAAVFRRAGRPLAGRFAGELQIIQPAERQLALKLLEFDHHFDIALEQLSPQVLCAYAYSLARCFTRFYDECQIVDAQSPETTESRLELCQLAANRIRLVLSLLGIETVDHM